MLIVIADWANLKGEGRWYLLRASIPVGGWTITLLNQLYLLAEQSTPLCKCPVAGRRTSAQSKRIHRVVATSAKLGAGTALHGHQPHVYGDSADIGQGEVIAQQAPKAKEFTPVRAFHHRALSERQVALTPHRKFDHRWSLPSWSSKRSSAGTTQVITKAW
jgi:hypothetical protein